MIIFEGPDGAGKTTLLKRISESLNLPIAPRVVSKDAEAMVDLQQWVLHNLLLGFHPVIYDRHRLISEPIYGPIMRDKFEPGFDDRLWMGPALERFYEIGPIVVYCLPPFDEVYDNVMGDDDNRIYHEDDRKVRLVWGAYFQQAMTARVLRPESTFIYDYTSHRADSQYRIICNAIKLQTDGLEPSFHHRKGN